MVATDGKELGNADGADDGADDDLTEGRSEGVSAFKVVGISLSVLDRVDDGVFEGEPLASALRNDDGESEG